MPEEISDKMVVLDVSEDVERSVWQMPGSIHIPLGQLRDRMEELPKRQDHRHLLRHRRQIL